MQIYFEKIVQQSRKIEISHFLTVYGYILCLLIHTTVHVRPFSRWTPFRLCRRAFKHRIRLLKSVIADALHLSFSKFYSFFMMNFYQQHFLIVVFAMWPRFSRNKKQFFSRPIIKQCRWFFIRFKNKFDKKYQRSALDNFVFYSLYFFVSIFKEKKI